MIKHKIIKRVKTNMKKKTPTKKMMHALILIFVYSVFWFRLPRFHVIRRVQCTRKSERKKNNKKTGETSTSILSCGETLPGCH